MAAPVIAEALKTTNGRTTAEVLTTGAGTAAGDTLAIIYASDYYTLAGMPNPTSSAGTPSLVHTVDIGTNLGHMKAYTCAVTSGGAKTVTIPAHVDCDIFGAVLRISSTVTVDDHQGQFSATDTVSHVAPSATTTGADRLLVCAYLASDCSTSFPADPYTGNPAGMTEQAEPTSSPFAALLVCSQEIAASGATGTRTATFFRVEPYAAITLAFAGSGAAPASLPPSRRSRLGALVQS